MKTPVIVAHRGLHDVHPENSLAAFRAAWDAGVTACECDIHLSADREVIVLHDDTLDRTTTGTGPVNATSLGALSSLRLRSGDGRPTNEPIPTLEQALDIMPADTRMLVEIKPHLRRHDVYHILRKLDPNRCIIQSFRAEVMELVRACDGRFETALLVEAKSDYFVERTEFGPWTGVHSDYAALDGVLVRLMHNDGKRVGAWTVNEDAHIHRMINLGIDMIISDRPLRVRDICNVIA
jgi:glycerophosphoryl diester phosphodiesterase